MRGAPGRTTRRCAFSPLLREGSKNIAAPLRDVAAIRKAYRTQVDRAGGALVEVDVDNVATIQALRTIFKFPQQPHGMSYVGSWTLPRRSFSFAVKISAAEHGVA